MHDSRSASSSAPSQVTPSLRPRTSPSRKRRSLRPSTTPRAIAALRSPAFSSRPGCSWSKRSTIDPTLGAAYLQRGYLRAFADLKAAEKDLRRGLELSPNDARGYARLASIVFADRSRGTEALELLDRARRIEPLEPEYDVTKAVYELYGRGDVAAADDLLVGVLQREPLYPPALGRLAELRFCCQGRLADAVQLGQQALALDPLAEWTRRVVIRSAVGMQLPQPGRDAARTAPEQIDLRNGAAASQRRQSARSSGNLVSSDR